MFPYQVNIVVESVPRSCQQCKWEDDIFETYATANKPRISRYEQCSLVPRPVSQFLLLAVRKAWGAWE